MGEVKRVPVNFQYHRLNWEFLHMMAEIAHYADEKYEETENYANGRMEGQKSPLNHIGDHFRQYVMRQPHDKYGDLKHQLAAIAYNAMMEFYQLERAGGPTVSDKLYVNKEQKEEAMNRGMQNAYAPAINETKPELPSATQIPDRDQYTGGGLLSGLFRRN